MSRRNLFITKNDFKRLQEILDGSVVIHARDRGDLSALTEEMKRATIVEAHDIPDKVVTMNTKLRLVDMDTKKSLEMTVVFPQDADVDTGKISVISPVGTAVLGYSEGDAVEWEVPAGKRHLLIESVIYQPEAAGDFNV